MRKQKYKESTMKICTKNNKKHLDQMSYNTNNKNNKKE